MTKEIKDQINEMLRKHKEGEINERYWNRFVEISDIGLGKNAKTYVMVYKSETITVYCMNETVRVITISDFDAKSLQVLNY